MSKLSKTFPIKKRDFVTISTWFYPTTQGSYLKNLNFKNILFESHFNLDASLANFIHRIESITNLPVPSLSMKLIKQTVLWFEQQHEGWFVGLISNRYVIEFINIFLLYANQPSTPSIIQRGREKPASTTRDKSEVKKTTFFRICGPHNGTRQREIVANYKCPNVGANMFVFGFTYGKMA